MAFLKKLFGSSGERSGIKNAEAAYAEALSKLGDATLDMYIQLMQVHDPSLKKDGLNIKYLRSLVLDAEVARGNLDDSRVFETGAKALADKTWPARFVALQILQGLGIRLAERTAPPAGRNPISLETVIQKIGLALTDPDPRIQETAKQALGVIEFNKQLRSK